MQTVLREQSSRKTVYIKEQIRTNVQASGYCVYYPSNILQRV